MKWALFEIGIPGSSLWGTNIVVVIFGLKMQEQHHHGSLSEVVARQPICFRLSWLAAAGVL